MKKTAQLVLRLEDDLRARLDAIVEAHPAMNISGLARELIKEALPSFEQRYLPARTSAPSATEFPQNKKAA